MARAQGARSQMLLAKEITYGTPPASGYSRMPFASTTLGQEQPLLDNELLGYGRDPLAPSRDAITSDGQVVVPVDAAAIGHWLTGLLGAPTSSGSGPYSHTFVSGGWALPSYAIEVGYPEVPSYEMFGGVKVDFIEWQAQRSGLLQATVGLIAQGMDADTVTGGGSPSDIVLTRFGHFNGSISRDRSSAGRSPMTETLRFTRLARIVGRSTRNRA